VDAVVGYMVYRMTLSSTGSQKSATLAFGLWFLCPVVVYMSGIQAQFDCISAMLALLSVLLLERDHAFLAGMMFGVAALTKLFPAALIFILVIYMIRKNPGSVGTRRLVLAIVGALAAFAVIYAPQIMEGTLMESMSFIISRASEEATIEQTAKLIGLTGLSVFIILAASFRYWRLPAETAVSEFRRFALLVLAGAAIMSTGPQYCIVCIPLLAYYAASHDRALVPWTILLGTFAVITAFFNNGLTLLAMSSEYLGLIEPSTLLELLESMDQPIFMNLTLRSIPVVIADLGVTACLLLISAFLWIGKEGMPSHRRIENVIRYVKAFGRHADGA